MSTYTEALAAGHGILVVLESDDGGGDNPSPPTWLPCSLPVEGEPTTPAGQTVDEGDEWPAGWLDRMFGCLKDSGLERQPQGEFEERDKIE